MTDNLTSNKRIVKNTAILYIRMLILLLISLYTVRVIFKALGVEDYGIYNIVGGIVVFFSFLNSGLSSATKRYITSELTNNDENQIINVFNICIKAHVIVALLVLLLSESIGVWVVNFILEIPENRLFAANCVFQFSIFSVLISILQSPFGALIVAYERMSVYAYTTIFEAFSKLLVALSLYFVFIDKLILYAFLLFIISLLNLLIYYWVCRRTFSVCKIKKTKDKQLLKEIFNFMTWSLLGQSAVVGTNQGVGVLINVYSGVIVNAAMGISNSIVGVVNNFVTNFQVAFHPQIIKLYTINEFDKLKLLVYRSAKLSSFLVLLFLTPLIFEVHNVLSLWLGDYPKYAIEFVVLTLLCVYFESISAPLWMLAYANKDIKKYQILISSVYSLNFLLSWIFLYLGAIPYVVLLIRLGIFMILLLIRLYYVYHLTNKMINPLKWLIEIIGRGIGVFLFSAILIFIVKEKITLSPFVDILLISFISLILQVFLILYIGLNKEERVYIINFITKKINRK